MEQASAMRGAKRQGARGVSWCFWACLAVAPVLAGCLFGGGIDAARDGGTAPYVISGRVLGPQGSTGAGVLVTLYPSGHDASAPGGWQAPTVVADSQGVFRFPHGSDLHLFEGKAARARYYSVVARSPDGALWRMVDSLRPNAGERADTLRLSAPRRLEIDLRTSGGGVPSREPYVVYVPGTDIYIPFENYDPKILDSLPVGVTRVVFRFGDNLVHEVSLPSVAAGDPPVSAVIDTVRIKSYPDGPAVDP